MCRSFRTGGSWYASSLSVRKIISIMLLRSYAPIRITAGKLYTLNLENFSAVRQLPLERKTYYHVAINIDASSFWRSCARHSLTSPFSVPCNERCRSKVAIRWDRLRADVFLHSRAINCKLLLRVLSCQWTITETIMYFIMIALIYVLKY